MAKSNTVKKTRELISEFNEKHGIETKNQGLMLGAEVGELEDAILKDNKEEMEEEIGDVLFVAISIAELEDIDPIEALQQVTLENMEKDASKEGSKVTKD